jgi:hypothetical protein
MSHNDDFAKVAQKEAIPEAIYVSTQERRKFKRKINTCRRLSAEISRTLIGHKEEHILRMSTTNLLKECSKQVEEAKTNFKKIYIKTQREVDKHLKTYKPGQKIKLALLFSQSAFANMINKTRMHTQLKKKEKLINEKQDKIISYSLHQLLYPLYHSGTSLVITQ